MALTSKAGISRSAPAGWLVWAEQNSAINKIANTARIRVDILASGFELWPRNPRFARAPLRSAKQPLVCWRANLSPDTLLQRSAPGNLAACGLLRVNES